MMKKILLLLLCLALSLGALVACNEGDTQTDVGTTAATASNPFADPTMAISVVYPDLEEAYYSPIVDEFIKDVSAATGVTLKGKSDFDKSGTTVSNDDYEILIGKTNRTESAQTECPEGNYVIKRVGNKLIIMGNDKFYTTFAIRYFLATYMGASADGTLFTVEAEHSETVPLKNAASTYVDLGEDISEELTYEKVTYFPFIDLSGGEKLNCMQGGCTDGEYFYFLMNDGDDETANSKSQIIKVDPSTLKIVKTGPTIYVRHANDMTYNSKTDQLVISWCSVDSKQYSVVDMDTLNVIDTGTVYNMNGFFAIDYCAEKDKYVVSETTNGSNEYRLQILTGKPGSIKVDSEPFDSLKTGYTKQGMHCDDKYIYLAQSPASGKEGNIVAVFDWEGNHVRTFTIDLPGESENIFWYNGNLYSAYNNNKDGAEKLALYKLTFNFVD